MRSMVGEIKKETEDWLNGLFRNWGLSGWVGSIIRTGLMILFVIMIALIAFGLTKRMIYKLVSSATSSPEGNQVTVPSAPEEVELEEVSTPQENDHCNWLTSQQWFEECYPESEYRIP